MSYTKKSVNVVTLLLTILTFICLHLINSQIYLLFNSMYYNNSKDIYSKKIPIDKQSNTIKTISINDNMADNLIGYEKPLVQKISKLEQELNEAQKNKHNSKTQRQIVKQNNMNKWRIEIPKISLNAHIEEGTTQEVLIKAIGHFENTGKWNGNVCLAAHNRGYMCNFFQKVKNLKVGDEIIYHTKQGKKIYKVQTNKIILETDWKYISQTKDNRITLVTCEENRGEYRRCIQAVQIAEYL